MLLVPLNPVPSQVTRIVLAGQPCTISVYQKFWGLFCDLLVSNVPVIQGVLCLNANFVVRDLYLGFRGDIAFFDAQGTSDPSFTGLGSRFLLFYLAQADLPATYGLSR